MAVPAEPHPDRSTASPPRESRPREARPRCPRCGAGMGRLAADGQDSAPVHAVEHYCGCCGLIAAVRPSGP
jgi:hypothetical protein